MVGDDPKNEPEEHDPLDAGRDDGDVDDDAEPSSEHGEHERHGKRRGRFDSVISELFKRAVELGVEKATEAPENLKHFVNERKLPKEAAAYIFSQVEDTKNGVFRVVAREMRDFLEHANLAHEAQKMLTSLQFEVNTTIRFRPAPEDEGEEGEGEEGSEKKMKPEVTMDVFAKRDGKKKKISKEG
jgi:hypothetical protein